MFFGNKPYVRANQEDSTYDWWDTNKIITKYMVLCSSPCTLASVRYLSSKSIERGKIYNIDIPLHVYACDCFLWIKNIFEWGWGKRVNEIKWNVGDIFCKLCLAGVVADMYVLEFRILMMINIASFSQSTVNSNKAEKDTFLHCKIVCLQPYRQNS